MASKIKVIKEVKPKQTMKPIAKKENLFFLGALFALALAGDLIWWESKKMTDEIENGAVLFSATIRSEYHDIDQLSQDIEAANADATRELNTLEATE